MSRYIFDIECNGFLETVTKIHSLVLIDVDTEAMTSVSYDEKPGQLPALLTALEKLQAADEIIGHNVISFDIPVIQKLYKWFEPRGKVTDTLVLSQLMHSDLKNEDAPLLVQKKIDPKMYGRHSLKAWGQRMGFPKDEYEGGFVTWSQAMQDYCEQDCKVTLELYRRLNPASYSQDAITLEHDVMEICARMERDGWPFDVKAAHELYAELAGKRDAIKASLGDLFPPWEVIERTYTYQRPNKKRGIQAGDTRTYYKTVHFNPSSRQHIERCLREKYGWKPSAFTESGQAKIDDDVLNSLPYPEAQALAVYFMVEKRIGQIAEGENGWLKLERKGRIHGSYTPNGTVTGRATHSRPNIAQVPSVQKDKEGNILYGLKGGYGYECRSLFHVPPGFVQLGADMSGLELRCLAHYMSFYDNGEYVRVVTEGDVHTVNQQAAGLPTRNNAKTFIYAFLYGAGDAKIGSIINGSAGMGKAVKERFMKGLPALGELKKLVNKACKKGFIKSIDGRHIPIRSSHAALNSLLQSTGSILCKRWMVEIDKELASLGLHYGKDYFFLGWIHDEVQIAVHKDWVDIVGRTCMDAAQLVGAIYKFKCPIASEYKVGKNWAETH